MKSTRKNMVLCLGLITLVASAGLGLVYGVTKNSIEEARNSATVRALSAVIADFDNNPAKDVTDIVLDDMPLRVFRATKGGRPSGYAVETVTRIGYSGEIRMMVGFTPEGEIYNIVVLEHSETPGLGSKITEPDNPLLLSFRGNDPADMNLAVRRDGGDVDAITASTITSRAYIDAVERAMRAFRAVAQGITETGVDHVAAVLPHFDGSTAREIMIDGDTVIVNTATRGGEVVGYAVQTESANGWRGGTIRLMVGFLPDGTINDISVMRHSETPGFGAAIEEPDNALVMSLRGRNAADIVWGLAPADGATGATEIKTTGAAKAGNKDTEADVSSGATETTGEAGTGTGTGTVADGSSGATESTGKAGTGTGTGTVADGSSGATGTGTGTETGTTPGKASGTTSGTGSVHGNVDGITGSTVTSKAYIEAVERAFRAFVTIKNSRHE